MNIIQDILRCSAPPYLVDESKWEQVYRFPFDFTGFNGHFPGNPILPAFIQICMARLLWSAVISPVPFLKIASAKFTRPIHPEEDARLVLCGNKAQIFVHGGQAAIMRISA